MPVLRHHQLQKRITSGTSLSVVLGVVVAVVLAACVIWAVVIPAIRKRQAPTPATTQWADGTVLTTRRRSRLKRTYPSHPAVRPLLSKPSVPQSLTFYNPRTESPFPDGPALHSVRFCSTRNLRAQSTPPLSASASSNGLFTPIKRNDLKNDNSKSQFHTVPRAADAKHVPVKSFDFGDAKDFILAVPEPLALKPRDAGRAPAAVRPLNRFNTSLTSLTASPAYSDKLLHPNKLFRALQGPEIRSSFCSSTSMRVDHRQSDAPADVAPTAMNNTMEETGRLCSETYVDHDGDKGDLAITMDHSQDKELANTHRLRSYRSLTAGESVHVTRAGTLTRPKTPVGELRRRYNQCQRSVTLPSVPNAQHGAVSAMFTSTDVGSDYESLSTPPTSPAFHPSDSCLLPTPLNLKKSFEPEFAQDIDYIQDAAATTFVGGQQCTDEMLSEFVNAGRAVNGQETRGFYHAGRRLTKPARLDIKRGNKAPPSPYRHSRRSITDFGHAVFGPLIKTNPMRSRARASSLYSRDTHGISMVNTPVTPDFPTPASGSFTDLSVCGNPFKAQESVKARIDEWTQRIEGKAGRPLPPIRHVSPMFGASRSLTDVVLDNSEDIMVETDADLGSLNKSSVGHGQDKEAHGSGLAKEAKWI